MNYFLISKTNRTISVLLRSRRYSCQRNNTGRIALELQALLPKLTACKANILAACRIPTHVPSPNSTMVEACDLAIKTLVNATGPKGCGESTDCDCWNKADLSTLENSINDNCDGTNYLLTSTGTSRVQLKIDT